MYRGIFWELGVLLTITYRYSHRVTAPLNVSNVDHWTGTPRKIFSAHRDTAAAYSHSTGRTLSWASYAGCFLRFAAERFNVARELMDAANVSAGHRAERLSNGSSVAISWPKKTVLRFKKIRRLQRSFKCSALVFLVETFYDIIIYR